MYSIELIPAGLHAALSMKLESITSQISTNCPLFIHISLPASFIADRFQLLQLHTEGRLGSYDSDLSTFQFKGEKDLEVPVYKATGSELLIRLKSGNGKGKEKAIEGEEVWELPLHLRYQVPVQDRWIDNKRNDTVLVEMDSPSLFFACESDQDAFLLSQLSIPSCPVSLDFSALVNTSSLHILSLSNSQSIVSCPPSTSQTRLGMTAPTGVLSDLSLVESINFVAIWFGMILISIAVFKLKKRLNLEASNKGKTD